jgi:hypothetical protein
VLTVRVALSHPEMEQLVEELLRSRLGCVVVRDGGVGPGPPGPAPCLLVVEESMFLAPDWDSGGIPVIVIGREPDASVRSLVLGRGAAAWIPREGIGDELLEEARGLLAGADDT